MHEDRERRFLLGGVGSFKMDDLVENVDVCLVYTAYAFGGRGTAGNRWSWAVRWTMLRKEA